MKYYVRSNQLKVIIAGDHITAPKEAACEACLLYYKDGVMIAPIIIVSERGFEYDDHENHEDDIFNTLDILFTAGL